MSGPLRRPSGVGIEDGIIDHGNTRRGSCSRLSGYAWRRPSQNDRIKKKEERTNNWWGDLWLHNRGNLDCMGLRIGGCCRFCSDLLLLLIRPTVLIVLPLLATDVWHVVCAPRLWPSSDFSVSRCRRQIALQMDPPLEIWEMAAVNGRGQLLFCRHICHRLLSLCSGSSTFTQRHHPDEAVAQLQFCQAGQDFDRGKLQRVAFFVRLETRSYIDT